MTSGPSALVARAVRFLGRVQFTMILLLWGTVAMVAGTILESREGVEAARAAVYRTWWFDLLLVLIGVNLVVAVVNRIPIKRHQWAFVLTHFSIVVLLIGGFVSRSLGYEGRLAVREGARSDTLLLETSEIRAAWEGAPGAASVLTLDAAAHPRGTLVGRSPDGAVEVRVEEVVWNGAPAVQLVSDGSKGSPGVEFYVAGRGLHGRGWLVADHPAFRRKDLGPIEIELLVARDEEFLRERLQPREGGGATASLRLAGGREVRIPLPERLGEEIDCGDGVVARVERFLRRARVAGGEVSESAEGPPNPAAVVSVRTPSGRRTFTVFSLFPGFNTAKGSGAGEVEAVGLEAAGVGIKPLATILIGPRKELYVQLSAAIGRGPGLPFVPGQVVAVGNLGIDLRVERLVEAARPEVRVLRLPPSREDGRAYARVSARSVGARAVETDDVWLAVESEEELRVGSARIGVSFRRQRARLPFTVALEDFEIAYHPGTNRPAAYRSVVKVGTEDGGFLDAVIAMNRPLDHAGHRLFQSSYRLDPEGGPATTILSVSYDPGAPIVYGAFVLLIAGVLWYVVGRSRRARAAELAARSGVATDPGARGGSRSMARAGLVAVWGAVVCGATAAQDGATAGVPRMPVEHTRAWAILEGGRVKPLDTFAREEVLAITGRGGIDGLSPLEVVWAYHLGGPQLREKPWIRIDGRALKAALDLPEGRKRFSFRELMTNPKFQGIVERAMAARRQGGETSRLHQDALEAYRKLELVAGLIRGTSLRVVPLPGENGAWSTPEDLKESDDPLHRRIYRGFAGLADAYAKGDREEFARLADSLGADLRAVDPTVYPAASVLERELLYNDLNAFGRAWVLYLIAFVVVAFAGFGRRRVGYWVGSAAMLGGLVLHAVGFGLRWAIAGRAPVSDMYESLVFLSLGTALLGIVLEFAYRKRFFLLAASAMGFLSLMLAERLPVESSINPLVPVLANTSWLAIHVMTVVLSYSAFAITMALGHVIIAVQLFRPGRNELLRTLSRLLYRALQFGLLFLAAGIAFGAVWANESWGRYWGWDPKETWSLITFFVYLGIVHARFAGWLDNFGLAVSAIGGFVSVLMTYYGVNFVLGTGLHSYGFASGGALWVALFVALDVVVIAVAYLRYRAARRAGLIDPAQTRLGEV